jgi:hypothetical protein
VRVAISVLLLGVLTGCAAAQETVPEAGTSPAAPTPSALPTAKKSKPVEPTPEPVPSITIPDLRIPPKLSGLITGGDVSWPQCPKGMGIPEKPTLGLPMPLDSAKFVILGLTNGPAFTPNPCLADQVQWVKDRNLMAAAYAVNSYPDDKTLARYGRKGPFDGSTRLGALSNVGYQQARYNLGTMAGADLHTPIIWLDVEPVPIFEWSSDKEANAAVVQGAARGYTDAGFQIGFYSTAYLWDAVVGDLSLGIPEWRAAGQTSREEALRRCGEDSVFQDGPAVLSQWVESNRDRNITCPGTSAELYRWFHQY